MIDKTDVRELRDVINEARIILNTAVIPDGRATHAKELLETAIMIADGLIARPSFSSANKLRKVRRQANG